ncbi:MAG: glycosyltransferase [Timaviella obliquedivisa GSE-PSE-MK23-08B]|nr:glycosyltransferase [Timaviella obliquedivisa GSE-PSE-MK23-08B]
MPKVSVIIPNYNHDRFLTKRVRSILDQTFQDFEIIYLDDTSTDNSDVVVAPFLSHFTHVIKNETNSGIPFKQWNKGASLAQGEYLWIAESDDYTDKHFLERLVDVLDRHPNVGLAYCQSWGVDEGDRILQSWKLNTDTLDLERWQQDFINNGKDECQRYLIYKNTVPNASATLIRRNVYEQVGKAEESLKLCGDWLTWIKILMQSDIAFVATPLNYFRTHAHSVRSGSLKYLVYAEESYQVLKYALQHCNIAPETANKAYQVMLERWYEAAIAHRNEAPNRVHIRIYRLANRIDPMLKRRLLRKALADPRSAEIEQLQEKLLNRKVRIEHLRSRLDNTQQELEQARSQIAAMETSKFWAIRKGWFRFKRMLRLRRQE